MVSMILAGIKHTTGYELSASHIAHTKDSMSIVHWYLGLGERLFSWCCSWAKNSKSFKLVQLPGSREIKDAVNTAKRAVTHEDSHA